MPFKGAHILSVDQFDRKDIATIFHVADQMRPYAQRQKITKILDGAILGNLFFEPSTRTRISFGCGFNLLGGFVRETTGLTTTAIAKGESLEDTAHILSGYSDVIVMRHPEEGSVSAFAEASRVPVINGGDGSNEHPTQALLDLYTIVKELKRQEVEVSGMKIAMIGDLKFGRTVHSLCKLLCLFENIEFYFISPKALNMPSELIADIKKKGYQVTETEDLQKGIGGVDVIYQTRIQEERFENLEEANQYRGQFRINQYIYSQYCQPSTIIMHPLPRDSRAGAQELDPDLDQHPNLAIFRQADNGVLIRMALFSLIFGIENEVDSRARELSWHTTRKLEP